MVEDEAAWVRGVHIARRDLSAGTKSGVKRTLFARRVVDLKAPRSVVQIDERTATRLGDHAHRLVEGLAAVAVGAEHVARGAAGVHAHQYSRSAGRAVVGIAGKACRSALERRAARAQVAADQRDVALAPVHLRLVGDHAKLAVACLDAALARPNHPLLAAQAAPD